MQVTLYSKFEDAAQAAQALAALVDRGASVKDLGALFPPGFQIRQAGNNAVEQAVSGISTTTGADAVLGAERGTIAGLGVGTLAAMASLLIPGFGFVLGGSGLITALIGVAGSAVGGGLAGGVAGYLSDQGVPERIALDSEDAMRNGRAILSVNCPTGSMGEFEVMEILSKYHAESFGRAESMAEAVTIL